MTTARRGELRYAAELVPGDRYVTHVYDIETGGNREITVTILGEFTPFVDRTGRDMFRFRARRSDTGAEDWVTFGPGGVVRMAGCESERTTEGEGK